jgi:dihydrofolate reductase
MLSLIIARADNGVIGSKGKLPWRLPADLKYFKAMTLGKPIIMGRKTWCSLGRPLPGRQNIVLTRQPGFAAAGASVAASLDEALALAQEGGDEREVMVIGGAEIYHLALARADRVYLTEVHARPPGDTCFPAFDATEWREAARRDHGAEQDRPAYSFVTLERVR